MHCSLLALTRRYVLLYYQPMQKVQDLSNITNEDILAALSRNDPEELQLLPIVVALSYPDRLTAQSVCVTLSLNSYNKIRGNALVSLGYLARRFRALDEPVVRPLIENGIRDSDRSIREQARSAADEIHQFLHWTISGHVYGRVPDKGEG